MSLKDENLSIQQSAWPKSVKTFAESFYLIDRIVDIKQLTSGDLKKYGDLLVFMDDHYHATHYDFQVKKCNRSDCMFCSIFQPSRLWEEPMLDQSKDYYRGFNKLWVTVTSKKDRPSLKYDTGAHEIDKKNRELLITQKVRDVIKCTNCLKPHCLLMFKA